MTTKRKTKIDDFEDDLKKIDPKIIEALKSEIKEDLKRDENDLKEKIKKIRATEKRMHTQYVNRMLKSDLPWFELVSTTTDDGVNEGLAYVLEWNTAFQQFLVSKGVMGANDLDRTTSWLVEMLHVVIEQKEMEKESEFE